MKKIRSPLNVTIAYTTPKMLKLKARPGNAKKIILFSFHFMDLNNDGNYTPWVLDDETNCSLSHELQHVRL